MSASHLGINSELLGRTVIVDPAQQLAQPVAVRHEVYLAPIEGLSLIL